MENNLEEFIKNENNILNVIKKINESFPEIIEKYYPTCPHRSAENYFMTGSCAAYAEMLYNLFTPFASYYDSNVIGHIVVKIGDYYYDCLGINNEPLYPENKYRYCDEEHLDVFKDIANKRNDVDKVIMPYLLQVGQEIITQELEKFDEAQTKTR